MLRKSQAIQFAEELTCSLVRFTDDHITHIHAPWSLMQDDNSLLARKNFRVLIAHNSA